MESGLDDLSIAPVNDSRKESVQTLAGQVALDIMSAKYKQGTAQSQVSPPSSSSRLTGVKLDKPVSSCVQLSSLLKRSQSCTLQTVLDEGTHPISSDMEFHMSMFRPGGAGMLKLNWKLS